MNKTLSERDYGILWHPYSPIQPGHMPLPVLRGEGQYLYLEDGRKIFDAISSWWVNLHGHAHPYLVEALHKQAQKLEQVIFAGFTHEPAVQLAERLLALWKGNMKRVFYSDNGSSAIEVALKTAIQWYAIQQQKPDVILALDGAFHGDTFGAMAVSGRGIFNEVFHDYLIPVKHLPFPSDPAFLTALDEVLAIHPKAIFIYEPLLQGAAGMRVYDSETLNTTLKKIHASGGVCIADEVMTGFGRTGTMFASEQVKEQPDIVCLSKGISGGYMPLSATLSNERIVDVFLSNNKHILYHGHSYTANPLACALGVASLELFEQENTLGKISAIHQQHLSVLPILKSNASINEVHCIGTVLSVEYKTNEEEGYLNPIRERSYQFFMERNILMRPLGNVSYVLPPYCSSPQDLQRCYNAMVEFSSQETGVRGQ